MEAFKTGYRRAKDAGKSVKEAEKAGLANIEAEKKTRKGKTFGAQLTREKTPSLEQYYRSQKPWGAPGAP